MGCTLHIHTETETSPIVQFSTEMVINLNFQKNSSCQDVSHLISISIDSISSKTATMSTPKPLLLLNIN